MQRHVFSTNSQHWSVACCPCRTNVLLASVLCEHSEGTDRLTEQEHRLRVASFPGRQHHERMCFLLRSSCNMNVCASCFKVPVTWTSVHHALMFLHYEDLCVLLQTSCTMNVCASCFNVPAPWISVRLASKFSYCCTLLSLMKVGLCTLLIRRWISAALYPKFINDPKSMTIRMQKSNDRKHFKHETDCIVRGMFTCSQCSSNWQVRPEAIDGILETQRNSSTHNVTGFSM